MNVSTVSPYGPNSFQKKNVHFTLGLLAIEEDTAQTYRMQPLMKVGHERQPKPGPTTRIFHQGGRATDVKMCVNASHNPHKSLDCSHMVPVFCIVFRVDEKWLSRALCSSLCENWSKSKIRVVFLYIRLIWLEGPGLVYETDALSKTRRCDRVSFYSTFESLFDIWTLHFGPLNTKTENETQRFERRGGNWEFHTLS